MTAVVHRFPDRFDDAGRRFEPWLDEEKIARHFDVGRRTVRRWKDQGMPSRMFGSSRRYQLSACEDWHARRAS